MNRKRAKLTKKKTSVAFSNFDLNYQRFDQDMERVTLPQPGDVNQPPQPSPKAQNNNQPPPQVGVNKPQGEEKKKDAGGCCTVF